MSIPLRTCAAMAIALASSAALAAAPTPKLSNGSTNPQNPGLATGSVSASGVQAPQGSVWSELQRDSTGANASAGVSCNQTTTTPQNPGYRIADDFTVPASAYGWRIASITFFAHAGPTAGGGAGSPFQNVHLRVWSGRPGDQGSTLVWDSAGTGQGESFLVAAPTSMFRIFNSLGPPPTAPDSTRRIWQLNFHPRELDLPSGAYWLDWQVIPTIPTASIFSPTVTIAGSRGRAGANAMQFMPVEGEHRWTPIMDPGKPLSAADVPQELPFMISASLAPPPCPGDGDGNGVVNFADVAAALTHWGFDYSPGTGPGDADGSGIVDFADVTAVLLSWSDACP